MSVSTDRAFPSFSAFLAAHDPYYSAVLTLSCLLPLTLALYIAFWSMDGWSNHPMVKKILPYASNGLWKDVVKVRRKSGHLNSWLFSTLSFFMTLIGCGH